MENTKVSVYNEIISWSQSRPKFIQDALRRIISKPSMSDSDIDEIILLLKKEYGDTSISISPIPIDHTHIPSGINTRMVYPKLISVNNPQNICALHTEASLQLSNDGLNVIYGNNGSGKSSYARILKKLCWSRSPNKELKKNLFEPSAIPQQVDFVIEENGTNLSFSWTENSDSHPSLKSFFVFDTDCGDIYVNSENPTEYKPVGIDLLEKLVPILGNVSQRLNIELSNYTTQKPALNHDLSITQTFRWYANIEAKTKNEIDSYIHFGQGDKERRQELFNLINTLNPQQVVSNLTSKRNRFLNYCKQLIDVESLFNNQNLEDIKKLRKTFERDKQAFDIVTQEMSGLNTIDGFGTSPWLALWESAKNFAHSAGMSDGINFPSSGSLGKCVLCQQELNSEAKKRLESFSKFVLNDISTQINSIQVKIKNKIDDIRSIALPPIENIMELENSIHDFKNKYTSLLTSTELSKNILIEYLQNGTELNICFNPLSPEIMDLIPNINTSIEKNNQLISNRNLIVGEYNELVAREFLFNNKEIILRYYDELKYKEWISNCQSQLNTSIISKKIGELMENQAVNLQHQEFIGHLGSFNVDLTSKVLIKKTRTSQGSTFQRCTLDGVADPISSVLSEGEQKIIALSNFLAECTIEGRKNTIIFDDPVNSLDMNYRDLIANKIVELSSDRQVIVFTHDLFFLRLLIDTHKENRRSDCNVISIDKYNGISGIVTDEIPYLAKNVQERIDSIRKTLKEHDLLHITDSSRREEKLDSARKRFRMLLERSVEELLSNKTYERFSKNIHLKKGYLSSYVVTEKSDIDFLVSLYGKYSRTEHDGGHSTVTMLPDKTAMEQDIINYSNWRDSFKGRLKSWKNINNYN